MLCPLPMGQGVCGVRHANIEPQHPASRPYCHSNILAFLPKWPPAEQVWSSSPGVRPRHSHGVAKCSCSGRRGGQSLDVQMGAHLRAPEALMVGDEAEDKESRGQAASQGQLSLCHCPGVRTPRCQRTLNADQQLPGGYAGTLVRAGW